MCVCLCMKNMQLCQSPSHSRPRRFSSCRAPSPCSQSVFFTPAVLQPQCLGCCKAKDHEKKMQGFGGGCLISPTGAMCHGEHLTGSSGCAPPPSVTSASASWHAAPRFAEEGHPNTGTGRLSDGCLLPFSPQTRSWRPPEWTAGRVPWRCAGKPASMPTGRRTSNHAAAPRGQLRNQKQSENNNNKKKR